MKIGDKVTVKNCLQKVKRYVLGGRRKVKIVEWLPYAPSFSVGSGIYLGKITLYIGDVVFESEEEGYIFERTGHISAVVVQPLDTGGRYRRPVYARPEDVDAIL